MDLPNYESFANTQLMRQLANIKGFTANVQITPVSGWHRTDLGQVIIRDLYDAVREIVKAAGFFAFEQIKVRSEGDTVAIHYSDDRYEFALLVGSDRLIIRRDGSSMEIFHEWYHRFMPSAHSLIQTACSVFNERLQVHVEPLRATLKFEYILYDLKTENGMKIRNGEVVAKLLAAVPDEDGILSEDPEIRNALGRVDLDLSRWTGEQGARRRLIYQVQAPANKAHSTLWANFQYSGETYEDPSTQEREEFSFDEFINSSDDAYVGFLRDKGINNFLRRLLNDVTFRSTSGDIP